MPSPSALFTSLSGLQAQSVKLATTSQNIANASTTGFKRLETMFTSLVNTSLRANGFSGGGVQAGVRRDFDTPGIAVPTGTSTDLSISGSGFFLVQGSGPEPVLLSREGSFRPDASGVLRNASGFALLGFPIDPATGQVIGSGPSDLRSVSVNEIEAFATPTTEAALDAVLPADFLGSTRIGDLAVGSPTRLIRTADFQTTIQVFDSQGSARQVTLDLFRVNESEPNLWAARVTGSNVTGLQPGKGARFIGATGPAGADIQGDNLVYLRFNGDGSLQNIYVEGTFGPVTEQLTVDPLGTAITLSPVQADANGRPALAIAVGDIGTDFVLNTAGNPVDPSRPFGLGGETRLAIPVPSASPYLQNGALATVFSVDFGTPTGLFANNDPTAAGFAGNGLDGVSSFATAAGTPTVSVTSFLQNGTSTSRSSGVTISRDGVVSAVFENGNRLSIARLPVGQVTNPDGLRAIGRSAFAPGADAGSLILGRGTIVGGSLESSNVNIDEELVNLIVARAAYTANARALAENAETLSQIVDVRS